MIAVPSRIIDEAGEASGNNKLTTSTSALPMAKPNHRDFLMTVTREVERVVMSAAGNPHTRITSKRKPHRPTTRETPGRTEIKRAT